MFQEHLCLHFNLETANKGAAVIGRADRKAPPWQFFLGLLTRAGSALPVTLQNGFLPFSLQSSTACNFIKPKPQHMQPDAVVRNGLRSLKVLPNTAAGEDKPPETRNGKGEQVGSISRAGGISSSWVHKPNPSPQHNSQVPNTLSHHDASGSRSFAHQ